MAVAIGAALTALAGCMEHPRGERYEETSQISLPLGAQSRLVIENARGTVRLIPSSAGTVRIEARKRVRAPRLDDARRLANETRVAVLRAGAELKIVVHYPSRVSSSRVRVQVLGRNVVRRQADVDLLVEVPEGVAVKVETRSGDLTAEGIAGALEFWTASGDGVAERHRGALAVHSSSGDFSVGWLEGSLDINTTSGDLRADRVTGGLRFETSSGDLGADEVGQELEVHSVSGDIEVERVRGPARVYTTSGDVSLASVRRLLNVTTGSGDVEAEVDSVLEQVSVETASGDVVLVLPESAGGRLDVVTASGSITTRLPLALQQATRRRLAGVMGPGRGAVAIHTSSGDIQVTSAGER